MLIFFKVKVFDILFNFLKVEWQIQWNRQLKLEIVMS